MQQCLVILQVDDVILDNNNHSERQMIVNNQIYELVQLCLT